MCVLSLSASHPDRFPSLLFPFCYELLLSPFLITSLSRSRDTKLIGLQSWNPSTQKLAKVWVETCPRRRFFTWNQESLRLCRRAGVPVCRCRQGDLAGAGAPPSLRRTAADAAVLWAGASRKSLHWVFFPQWGPKKLRKGDLQCGGCSTARTGTSGPLFTKQRWISWLQLEPNAAKRTPRNHCRSDCTQVEPWNIRNGV